MSRLVGHIAKPVDPVAPLGEAGRWRHAQFISRALAMTLPFLALAPAFLLAPGAPGHWDALAFAFLLAPLAGVYALQRYGRFDIAQTVCVGAIILLGVTLACAHGALTAGAFACFLLAPLQAAMGGDSRLVTGAAAISLAAVAIIVAATLLGLLHPHGEPGGNIDFAIVAAAMLYGALLAVWSARAGEARDRRAAESLDSYRELTEIVGDMALQLDQSGVVARVVSNPVNGFGCGPGDFLGRGLFERILVSDRPKYLKALWDAASAERAVVVEFRLRAGPDAGEGDERAPPHFVWVEMRAHRSLAAKGVVLAMLRDMTPMMEAREALEAAREASERANLWKDRFLANVSHELRTPLNAIIGFSEVLGSPDLAPKDTRRQCEYADIIHVSGQHLLSLVNMILDMSKIEAGNFEIEPEPFDFAELVDFCCDVVKLKAEDKNITLTRACLPQLDEIIADKRACKQILLNILSNAVKFTPEGGKVALVARPDGAFVEIVVTDTGIGVTQNDLSRLGDPFFQARATYDRPYEGAGLGLSIVRGLVGLHGGAIVFESAPSEGACVTVRLPLDCRMPHKSAAHPAKIETLARRGRVVGMMEPVSPPLRPNLQVKKIA
jgi:two-component system, cell cycle sensor histidine kinase DivJ